MTRACSTSPITPMTAADLDRILATAAPHFRVATLHAALLLHMRPRHRPGDLARHLKVTPAAVGKLLDGFETRGWVLRKKVKADGRGTEVVVLAPGRRAFAEIFKDLKQ